MIAWYNGLKIQNAKESICDKYSKKFIKKGKLFVQRIISPDPRFDAIIYS